MKIGILSDTHGTLDKQVFTYFRSCDEIWHAGDIGSLEVAQQLSAFKPLRAVHGNIDDTTIRRCYPEDQRFTCQGLDIWITHIAGKPPTYTPRIRKLLQARPPDILVCGHTHILRVIRDQSTLYLNPGATGWYGIHTIRTLLRFEIQQGKPCNMEVIELGKKFTHLP